MSPKSNFTVPEAYDDFMGRYSRPLAPRFAEFSGVAAGMRVLDVGCGPGALTEILAGIAGAGSVAAADPSPAFVAACAARVPGADVREAPAEKLPWDDGTFDAALAQLVVHFMRDRPAGIREMARVVRPGGTVAACMWDAEGGMTLLNAFWRAATALDPSAPVGPDRSVAGTPGGLEALWSGAGLEAISIDAVDVSAGYRDFDELWATLTAGVGPAGAYCASLEPAAQDALRAEFRSRVGDPDGAFELDARAWAVRGTVPTAN